MRKRRTYLIAITPVTLALIAATLACGLSGQTPETPTPTPTEEVNPPLYKATSTPVPGACTDSLEFLADVTVPDGATFSPNEPFVKTWRVRNNGDCDWVDYHIVFDHGEPMGTMDQPIQETPAGEEVEISVEMTAPDGAGHYTGYWQVQSPEGATLATLDCSIAVESEGEALPPPPTAAPTAPPPPPTPVPTDPSSVPPAAPTNLAVTSWAGAAANMSFVDNSDNEAGFRVYVNGSVHQTLEANTTTFQVAPGCGETWSVQVAAFNAAGESGLTGAINVSGVCEPPAAPSSLAVTGWSGNMANMRFQDNSNNEDGFRVYANGGLYRTLGPNETSFQVGPGCGSTYSINVTAFNSSGESAPTNTINVSGVCELPAAPSNLAVISWSGNMANMRFQDNSNNEDGFRVYANGGLYRTLGPNETSFQVGPGCGSTYSINVTAFNSSGESAPTNTINVSGACPLLRTVPAGPILVEADLPRLAKLGWLLRA